MTDTSSTSPADGRRCPRCSAPLRPDAERCWLCGAQTGAGGEAATAAAPPVPSESFGQFSLASLLLIVTLVSVVLGLLTIAPGVGVLVGIVLLIVWLRTAAVTRRRAARGLPVSWSEQTQLFFSSLGVTTLLLSLVCIAGFAAFWAACLSCLGTYVGLESMGSDFALTVAYIVCGVVVAAMLFVALKYAVPWSVRWIRRRWRRDIGETDESAGT